VVLPQRPRLRLRRKGLEGVRSASGVCAEQECDGNGGSGDGGLAGAVEALFRRRSHHWKTDVAEAVKIISAAPAPRLLVGVCLGPIWAESSSRGRAANAAPASSQCFAAVCVDFSGI